MYVTRAGKVYPSVNYVRKYDRALHTAVTVSATGRKQYTYPKTHVPLYVDGLNPRSIVNIRRRKALDGKCYDCGKTKVRLHAHHLDGNSYAKSKQQANNSLDNLITLCPSCHAMRHTAVHHPVRELLNRREKGETLAAIGQSYGISRQRVYQLIGHLPRKLIMDIVDVKALREQMNWTPAELAAKLGVSTRSIARWEQGKKPTQAMARQLRRLVKKAAKLKGE